MERPSTLERSTASWAANPTRISSASASHSRVEPSISVNRNVTVPDGRSAISHLRSTRPVSQNPQVRAATTQQQRVDSIQAAHHSPTSSTRFGRLPNPARSRPDRKRVDNKRRTLALAGNPSGGCLSATLA